MTEPKELKQAGEFSPLESFLNFAPPLPNGDAIESPEELSGALASFLHDKVPQVMDVSIDSLKALDAYFEREPPASGFTSQFLLEEFLPALGSYLADVLRHNRNGQWILKKPPLKSTVRVGSTEMVVFEHAFRVVYEGRKLTAAIP
jgi:hypothetical protein